VLTHIAKSQSAINIENDPLPITDRLGRVSLNELLARPISKRAADILFLTSLYINTTIFVLAERHNAANHPPPRPTESDDIVRVGGRVHWLVRVRVRDSAHLPIYTTNRSTTFDEL